MPSKIEITEEMWEQLRMEYISSDISVRALAKKHGVPYSQLRYKYEAEHWNIQKDDVHAKTTQNAIDIIAEYQANESTKAFRIANKAMDKLAECLEVIDPNDAYATRNLKTITSAIKDLKEIGLFRSMLDQAEQEARIKKLQKDAEEESVDKTITVTFMENDYAD